MPEPKKKVGKKKNSAPTPAGAAPSAKRGKKKVATGKKKVLTKKKAPAAGKKRVTKKKVGKVKVSKEEMAKRNAVKKSAQSTVSDAWITHGIPMALWKVLRKRSDAISLGRLKELKDYFMDERQQEAGAVTCTACKKFYEKPVTLPCMHVFCERCVKKSPKCRQCGKPHGGDYFPVDKRRLKADMDKLRIRCPLGNCEWSGTLAELRRHVRKVCAFQPQDCAFAEHGCKVKLLRCTAALHQASCKYCPPEPEKPQITVEELTKQVKEYKMKMMILVGQMGRSKKAVADAPDDAARKEAEAVLRKQEKELDQIKQSIVESEAELKEREKLGAAAGTGAGGMGTSQRAGLISLEEARRMLHAAEVSVAPPSQQMENLSLGGSAASVAAPAAAPAAAQDDYEVDDVSSSEEIDTQGSGMMMPGTAAPASPAPAAAPAVEAAVEEDVSTSEDEPAVQEEPAPAPVAAAVDAESDVSVSDVSDVSSSSVSSVSSVSDSEKGGVISDVSSSEEEASAEEAAAPAGPEAAEGAAGVPVGNASSLSSSLASSLSSDEDSDDDVGVATGAAAAVAEDKEAAQADAAPVDEERVEVTIHFQERAGVFNVGPSTEVEDLMDQLYADLMADIEEKDKHALFVIDPETGEEIGNMQESRLNLFDTRAALMGEGLEYRFEVRPFSAPVVESSESEDIVDDDDASSLSSSLESEDSDEDDSFSYSYGDDEDADTDEDGDSDTEDDDDSDDVSSLSSDSSDELSDSYSYDYGDDSDEESS